MKSQALVLVGLLLAAALATIVAVPSARAGTTYMSGQLVASSGSTSAFGGGDYRFIEFGSDAAFGVVWGNATHANNIYVVAIKARYLGVAQVSDGAGNRLLTDKPIKVYTVYAAQLQNIVEYRDVTGDGVANYTRTYDPASESWSNYLFAGDVGQKLSNLSANWIAGDVTTTPGDTYRTWEFNLTASNLAYYNISSKAKLTGSLPLVRFTFHLNASLVQVDNVEVPQFDVTVGQVAGRYTLTSVVRIQNRTLESAKFIHYDLKWDQLIQGWSYAGGNPSASRRLLLEIGTLVANYVPPDVLAGWRILNQLNDAGRAQYDTDAGNETADNSTGAYSEPRVFKSPMLDFGGNWTRIARFLWTTNSTVDGANATLLGQVVGGWGFATLSPYGLSFGFVLLIGLNYAGGDVIAHDPTVTADVTTDLAFGPAAEPNRGLFIAVVLGVIILVAFALVALMTLSRRRKKAEPPASPPMAPPP